MRWLRNLFKKQGKYVVYQQYGQAGRLYVRTDWWPRRFYLMGHDLSTASKMSKREAESAYRYVSATYGSQRTSITTHMVRYERLLMEDVLQ